jgi:hypothetical protein
MDYTPLAMATRKTTPRTGPLIVHVGRQDRGATFALSPETRLWLRKVRPDATLPRQVHVALDATGAFQDAYGPLWLHVVQMLSGLDEAAIRALGGARAIDPVTDREIWVLSSAA